MEENNFQGFKNNPKKGYSSYSVPILNEENEQVEEDDSYIIYDPENQKGSDSSIENYLKYKLNESVYAEFMIDEDTKSNEKKEGEMENTNQENNNDNPIKDNNNESQTQSNPSKNVEESTPKKSLTWNEEFQEILEARSTRFQNKLEKFEKIYFIVNNFFSHF